MTNNLVLAFDIERSGATSQYDTIAIGAVVLDSNFKELDRYYMNCYFPGETKFEDRCYTQFWSKNLDVLENLIYTGDLSMATREKEMIAGFQEFRAKWENYARENDIKLYLASDNNVYDGGFINELIYKHMPGALPIPYSASTQEYESFYESHSMIKGFLLAHDINEDWGLYDKLKKLYDVPDIPVMHDHNPANDAFTIAFEIQVLFGLYMGHYDPK